MLDKTFSIICAFGLAAVAPRSPYRHLELCGIALGVRKTVFEKWNSSCLSGLVTSTRLGRGSIKSHVRTVQGVGMGLFAFQERVTSLARCNNTHDFVPKSCAKDAAPFGIPAHTTHGRCRFAAQKRRAPQRRTPAVCGEGKALLRKCNNPL